jgi:hypothetical protein
MNKNLGKGWRPDTPDYRDKIFRADNNTVIPPYIDIQHQSPVRDQGQEGSCVGHAVAAGMDYLDRTDEAPQEMVTFSPRDAYYKARLERGDEGADTGAEVRLAIKVAVRDGICPDPCWPYRAGEWNKKPPSLAKRTAKATKLGSYEKCDSLNSILIALAQGHVLAGGFTCFSNMFTPEVDRTGVVPLPEGKDEGGHATLFCRLNLPKKLIGFKNHWSVGWGNKGYGWLPFYFFEQKLADDFWAMIKEA